MFVFFFHIHLFAFPVYFFSAYKAMGSTEREKIDICNDHFAEMKILSERNLKNIYIYIFGTNKIKIGHFERK